MAMFMQDQLDTTLAMLVAFRMVALLVGAMLLFFGYNLFKLGDFEQAGEVRAAWGDRRFLLKTVYPGVFFALFGTIIVCVGIWKPLSVRSPEGTPTQVIAALQKVVINQPLTDAERTSIAAWLQQRRSRNLPNYEASGPDLQLKM